LAGIHSEENLVSIVVPTFREAENIPILCREIDAALRAAGLPFEIVIVDDDSGDGIAEAVESLRKLPLNISLMIRKGERGLASAVIEGFRHASGDVIVVMDADLSHPPGKIPDLAGPIIVGEADFVIGSRFIPGGSAGHFNAYRKWNALISRMLARPLTGVGDPMAGFFAFPRKLLTPEVALAPLGFKIGLEMIVRAAPKRIREVGIHFQKRLKGKSKLSLKEQLCFLMHLARLYAYKMKNRR
jgi:dolichol-phosphate mannosyltransferase